MKLSQHPLTRREQVISLYWHCMSTAPQRTSFYEVCRQRYLFGGTPFAQARINKTRPHVDRKAAFLYAPDSIKFWVEVTPGEDFPDIYDKLDPVSAAIEDWWWRTDTDRLFALGVRWSLVYGTMILCVQPERT